MVSFLSSLATELQCANILSVCHRGSILLVHEPAEALAMSILECARALNITVYFSTSNAETGYERILIDAYSSKRALQSSIPTGVSIFVDCTTTQEHARSSGLLIASYLPDLCLKTTLSGMESLQHVLGLSATELGEKFLGGALQRAMKNTANIAADSHSGTTIDELPLVGLDQLVSSDVGLDKQIIVDWTGTTKVPVQLSTVENQVKFRADRTYVLFGLTSDLAQSICEWMASHGAKNIVLTSRNPKIEPGWRDLLSRKGVRLEVFAK